MSDGLVADFSRECGDVEAKLFAFEVNSAALGARHIAWLDDHVVPLLNLGGSLALVGEASRSGSDRQNLTLSQRRAGSVTDYLARRVRGRVRARDATTLPLELARSDAVGERLAASMGQPDGSEDEYYRAVRVRAWRRPDPPSPPEPREKPPKLIRRVISRRWNSISTRTPGGGNPYHDGEGGAFLGDLVNSYIDYRTQGGSDRRAYHDYPDDWCVVRVHDYWMLDDHLWTGPVSTTSHTHRVDYEYGPCTPTVTLFTTEIVINKANMRREERTTRSYPRSEIWGHTIAPDARVFGQ